MSSSGSIRKMQARTSQAQTNRGLHRFLAGTASESCNLPCTPSPMNRSVEWRGMENDTGSRKAWLTHSLPGAGSGERQNHECWLVARASLLACALQTGRFHRAPSLPDLPMSHSVTRFGAYPAPCSTARLCFGLRRPMGFGFQKIFSATLRTQRGRKDFPNLPKKRHLALGSGAHSRRFAQECPE